MTTRGISRPLLTRKGHERYEYKRRLHVCFELSSQQATHHLEAALIKNRPRVLCVLGWAGHITCLCPAAANTTTLELSQKSDDGKQRCRGGGEGLAAPRLGGHSRNFAAARTKKMDLTRVEISNGLQVGTSCHCAGHREERRVLLLVQWFY